MIYLSSIEFPSADAEMDFIIRDVKHTCYTSFYPFKVLPRRGLERIDFDHLTILQGGNGSGKTTALNAIAEKAGVRRDSLFNRSNFYADFLRLCHLKTGASLPDVSRIITSDDVFDHMLKLRSLNQGIDHRRDEILDEYLDAKYSGFRFESMEDHQRLKKTNDARRKTQSQFVRDRLEGNVPGYSNGESAFVYFTERISEAGLFILDEPENSLSPKRQIELAGFIVDSVRFFGCQIIMSTHSPFLLAMKGAKIYNLDENPAAVRHWTELEHVRAYYDFFMQHSNKFSQL